MVDEIKTSGTADSAVKNEGTEGGETTASTTQTPDTATKATATAKTATAKAGSASAKIIKPAAAAAVTEEVTKGFTDASADPTLVAYVNTYLNSIEDKSVKPAQSAKALSTLFRFALANPTTANLNGIKSFFTKYKDSIVTMNVALQGCEHLPTNVRVKVETMYTVFFNITNNRTTMNVDMIRKYLGDEVVAWLARNKK